MPLGACMVAEATARAGQEVQLLGLMFSRSPVRTVREALARQQPDLVGLSIRNIDNNDMQHPEFYPADLTPIPIARSRAPSTADGTRQRGVDVCKLAEMGFRNIEFVDNVFNSPFASCLGDAAWQPGRFLG